MQGAECLELQVVEWVEEYEATKQAHSDLLRLMGH